MGLNEIVDRGVNGAVNRRLGITSLSTLSLTPELSAILPLPDQPEIVYNLGYRRYAHTLQMAQVAAQRGHSQLRIKPSLSGKPETLVVLESIVVDAETVSGNFVFVDILGTAAADLANPFPAHAALDYRMVNAGGSLTQQSQTVLSTLIDGTAPTLGVFYAGSLLGTGPNFIPNINGICLTNSMGVRCDLNALNAPGFVTYTWRERMLNDQEAAV